MAVTSGFFNASNKDRYYSAKAISQIFDGVLSDGILNTIGDKFVCKVINNDGTISIGSGFGYFKGYYIYNPIKYNYKIPSNLINDGEESPSEYILEITKEPQLDYPLNATLDLGNIIMSFTSPTQVSSVGIVIELDERNRLFNIKAIDLDNFNPSIHMKIANVSKENGNLIIENVVGCSDGTYLIPGILQRTYIDDLKSKIDSRMSIFIPSFIDAKSTEFEDWLTNLEYYLYHHSSGPTQYQRFVSELDGKSNKKTIYRGSITRNSTSKVFTNITIQDDSCVTVESKPFDLDIKNIVINNQSHPVLYYEKASQSYDIRFIVY